MASGSVAVEVRTFESEQEVRDLDGFIENNLVDLKNYQALIGDYRFPEKMRCCLRRPSGTLCNTPHNYGFVVRLTDGTVSIIGNDCGTSKFDAESNLSRDKNLFRNLKKKRDTQLRLAELLAGKDAAVAEIRAMYDTLAEVSRRMDHLLAGFGQACANKLKLLSHGGTGAVVVTGVRIRTGELDGEKLIDRDRVSIPVGAFRGVHVLRSDLMRATKDELRQVARAFDIAERLSDDVKTSELERIASTIADLGRVLEAGRQFVRAEQEFMASDWSPLPFLVRQDSDRTKLAREALSHGGTPCGRDKAKQWLQAFESDLKNRHGVDRLEIAY